MKTLLLIALQLVANGSDAYYTNRNMSRHGFHETNPVQRAFVHNSTSLALFSTSEMAGVFSVEHLLRKHHRGRLARAMALTQIGTNTYGAAHSAREGH